MFNPGILLAGLRTYIRNKKGRKFEPEIQFLKDVLNEGDICFHIGASDARHSFVMSQLIKNGHIYAFEPSTYSYQHLVLMKKLHGLNNLSTFHAAMSEKPGKVSLITPKKSTGHAGRSFAFIAGVDDKQVERTDIEASGSVSEEVDAMTIDGFVSQNEIEKVDFIRCDTEGSEMLILSGAKQTLEKHKPHMLIEIHSDALKNIFDSSSSNVTSMLFDYGYRMFREDDGRIHEVESVNQDERWKDYFFIHPDRVKNLPMGDFKKLIN